MPNAKVLSEKQAIVAELTEKLQGAAGGVLVDYKGITVAEDTALRAEMRKNGVDYAVVKNTLTRFAVKNAGLDELEPGTFGVLEPRPDPARLVKDFSSGLCLIPALCYDWHGYRLGYGKGYYDRFLANFGGHMVGICYSECVRRKLPHGRFDRPAELLVTERYLRRTGDRRG